MTSTPSKWWGWTVHGWTSGRYVMSSPSGRLARAGRRDWSDLQAQRCRDPGVAAVRVVQCATAHRHSRAFTSDVDERSGRDHPFRPSSRSRPRGPRTADRRPAGGACRPLAYRSRTHGQGRSLRSASQRDGASAALDREPRRLRLDAPRRRGNSAPPPQGDGPTGPPAAEATMHTTTQHAAPIGTWVDEDALTCPGCHHPVRAERPTDVHGLAATANGARVLPPGRLRAVRRRTRSGVRAGRGHPMSTPAVVERHEPVASGRRRSNPLGPGMGWGRLCRRLLRLDQRRGFGRDRP